MTSETGFVDAALDPRTDLLALAQIRGPLEIWDLATGERRYRLELAEDSAASVALNPIEPILYVGTASGSIHALRLGTQLENAWTISNAHSGGALALAAKPDGRRLVSGGGDGVVRLWDTSRGTLLYERKSHTGSVWDLGFTINHPKGSYVASVGADGDLRWIDANLLLPYPTTQIHKGRINDIDFATDGTYATAGSDGLVALFDADRTFLVAGRRFDLGAPVSSITAAPDGASFTVAFGATGKMVILDAASRTLRTSPFAARSPVTVSAYHPSGLYLALGTWDGRTLLWAPGATEAREFAAHDGEIVDLAFHPNGRSLVTLGADQRVLRWDINETDLSSPRVLDTAGWRALAFDPTGALLAMGRSDGSIRVIDFETGEDAAVLQDDPPIFATKLAFHPRLPLLAAGDGYGQVRFWDIGTFTEQPPRLVGHHGEINGIAFDLQRKRLITSGRDAEIRVWELDTGVLAAVLGGHQGVLRSLAFSTTRSEAISGGLDGLVIIRSLDEDQWVEDGCRLYGRDFTPNEVGVYSLEPDRELLCRPELFCPGGGYAPRGEAVKSGISESMGNPTAPARGTGRIPQTDAQ